MIRRLDLPVFAEFSSSFAKCGAQGLFWSIHPLTPPPPLLDSAPHFCGAVLPTKSQLTEKKRIDYLIYG
jgi:hypothetical protein